MTAVIRRRFVPFYHRRRDHQSCAISPRTAAAIPRQLSLAAIPDTLRPSTPPIPTPARRSSIPSLEARTKAVCDQRLPKPAFWHSKSDPRDGHDYQVTVAASDGVLQDTQALKVHVRLGRSCLEPPEFPTRSYSSRNSNSEIVRNRSTPTRRRTILELDHALFRHADANMTPSAMLDLIQDHSFHVAMTS